MDDRLSDQDASALAGRGPDQRSAPPGRTPPPASPRELASLLGDLAGNCRDMLMHAKALGERADALRALGLEGEVDRDAGPALRCTLARFREAADSLEESRARVLRRAEADILQSVLKASGG